MAGGRLPRAGLFDAHCHLQLPRLLREADGVVEAARLAGVTRAAVNGCGRDDWPQVLGLAERFPDFVVPQFGVHPWCAGEHEGAAAPAEAAEWASELAELLRRTPHAGLGECGLDSARKKVVPMEVQRQVLERQLEIAAELGRPVSLHCVGAHGALLEVLQRAFGAGGHPPGLVLHSYCGSAEMVPPFLKLGCFFSFSASVLHTPKHAEALRAVPRGQLLLETDSPDQLPRSLCADGAEVPEDWGTSLRAPRVDEDGKPMNEPALLRGICAGVAAMLGETEEGIAAITAVNAQRVFELQAAGAAAAA